MRSNGSLWTGGDRSNAPACPLVTAIAARPGGAASPPQSGAPIDLLFSLGVQSLNGLPNGATSGGAGREASEGFQALMAALREVQSAGAVSLCFAR